MSHQQLIAAEITRVAADLSGYEPEELAPDQTFLQLGFDSLFLTQLATNISNRFETQVTFRSLFSEYPSISELARHLESAMPKAVRTALEPAAAQTSAQAPEPGQQQASGVQAPAKSEPSATPPPAGSAVPSPTSSPNPSIAAGTGKPVSEARGALASLLNEQLVLMARQLELLSGTDLAVEESDSTAVAPVAETVSPAETETPATVDFPAPTERVSEAEDGEDGSEEVKIELPPGFGPGTAREETEELDTTQRRHLEELVASYTQRTEGSKDSAQRYRQWHADPRTASGFNPLWKEMVYPIVVQRSKGARLWDVDGNEYIDLLNGFGPNFLGHSPDFITEALIEQLRAGVEIGPQTPLAGETARMICEFSGMDRATFVNTGSEAVQAAIRVARTVAGRDGIVVFSGDYHGNFDEVLVRAVGKPDHPKTVPMAPGVPRSSVSQVRTLPYGEDTALDFIEQEADQLAAVVVEPIQSRRPELQPRVFLERLRELTEAHGIVLIFDEVITGFRCQPGGAQAYYGIEADLVTFGKIVGGGMPIGVVAGRKRFMDTFDGGFWQYGDDSFPEAGVTFFAGTFIRHPLTIKATYETVKYLLEQGPEVYARVNASAEWLCARLNALFERHGIDVEVPHCNSQIFVRLKETHPLAGLLFYHLRLRGIYIQEGFPCYLTDAHDRKDLEQIVRAFEESVDAMIDAGIFHSAARPSKPFPLTDSQLEIWLDATAMEEAACAYNESDTLRLVGPLDAERLRRCLDQVVESHAAFRLRFADQQQFLAVETGFETAYLDLLEAEDDPDVRLEALRRSMGRTAFDLEQGPVCRATLVRTRTDEHYLVFGAHHLVYDGWSAEVLLQQLAALYAGDEAPSARSMPGFPAMLERLSSPEATALSERSTNYWVSRLRECAPETLDLPNDRPRPPAWDYAGETLSLMLDRALVERLRAAASRRGVTMYALTLAAFRLLLARLSGGRRFAIGTSVSSQPILDLPEVIGDGVNFIPVPAVVDPETPLAAFLDRAMNDVFSIAEHPLTTLGQLVRRVRCERDLSRPVLAQVVFNYAPESARIRFPGLEVSREENPRSFVHFDLFANLTETEHGIALDWDYPTALFDEGTIRDWMTRYERLLMSMAEALEQDATEQTLTAFLGKSVALSVPSDSGATGARMADHEAGGGSRDEDPAPAGPAMRESPVGEVEEAIAGIWAELLRAGEIGRGDNFFELGGHSLLATRVTTAINKVYGSELGLADLLRHPTVAGLAALVSLGDAGARLPPIEVTKVTEAPASFGQQRMWFLEQFEGDAGVFTIPVALHLQGELDVPALEQALVQLCQRQSSLRTRFEQRGDGLLQVIEDQGPALERRGADNLEVCRSEISRLAGQRLELEGGLPWRAVLFEIAPADQVLFLHFHHAIVDGLSLPILFDELSALYTAVVADQEAALEPLPVRYQDYAAWQRRLVDEGTWDEQADFWRERLSGRLPVLDLPTDHPRPAQQTFEGGSCRIILPPELVHRLESGARSQQGTLFNALLAGFYALLQRYSGQDDLVVGTPVSTRSRPELEPLVGLFINTLALRQQLDPEISLRALLLQTRDLCTSAFAHQDLPFERLVSELTVERDVSRTPVFQAQFAFRDAEQDAVSMPGLTGVLEPVDRRVAPTDIALWVERTDGAVHVEVEYPVALFDAATIEQMLGHYQRCLEQMVSNPDQKLREVEWLDRSERDRVLHAWNATERTLPEASLLEIIADHVAARPEAPAVCCGDHSLTYGELDRAANTLAARIVESLGARETQPIIGLALPRSEQLVVAMLAAWKAGCAGLPLDPGFPRERLSYMARDAGAALLLIDEALGAPLNFDGPTVAVVGTAPAPETPPPTPVADGDLAYVIYTSGSTGQPKGVRVGFGQLRNFLHSMAREPGLTADDVLLAVTTLSFDISLLELLLPLTTGASVVVASQDDIVDARVLGERISASKATVMQATPSTWRMLLDSDWSGEAGLRALSGGEPLPKDLVEALLPRVAELWNLYGPTETTVWSSRERINDASARITVGRPIDNTRIYIIDRYRRPVPPGVAGEIAIGGAGVAEGYHEREDLTRERFLDDPFAEVPNARMYLTGDVGRFLPDGRIEHLGRIDSQVKLRGFRIELGEIEASLNEQPGVEQAAARVFELAPGDQRLVAYLVTQSGQQPSTIALRKSLRQRLPDYMIPQHFEAIDTLPLTANGKLDRNALPRPEVFGATVQAGEAPVGEVEKTIAEIWSDLLAIEPISRDDNFFEIGGHSLLAMRAIQVMDAALGHRLPPQLLVMNSLREVAEILEARSPGLAAKLRERKGEQESDPHPGQRDERTGA